MKNTKRTIIALIGIVLIATAFLGSTQTGLSRQIKTVFNQDVQFNGKIILNSDQIIETARSCTGHIFALNGSRGVIVQTSCIDAKGHVTLTRVGDPNIHEIKGLLSYVAADGYFIVYSTLEDDSGRVSWRSTKRAVSLGQGF